MKVFFWGPCCISFFAAAYMAFMATCHPGWRVLVVVIVFAAAALQCLDWFVEAIDVHFLIPMGTQIIVTICVAFYASLEEIYRSSSDYSR